MEALERPRVDRPNEGWAYANGNGGRPDEATRRRIAVGIVIAGVLLLIVVSGVAIGFAGSDDRPEMARLVFASAVPLLGTWVGTVLAFYFARENLQAAADTQRSATESTVALASRLAPTTPVTTVMIPVNRIDPQRVVADAAEANALKLNELYRAGDKVLGWLTHSDLARIA